MRRPGLLTVGVVIGLLSMPLAAGDAPAAPASERLAGVWEGFIAETPARLTRVVIEFERVDEAWEGSIDLPGAEGLPLSAIRAEGADLHFELRVEDTLVLFDATAAAEKLSGHVVEGDRSFEFDLRKLPAYPATADRVEGWRQDLDVVRNRFLEYDRSFDPAARAAFETALDRLGASLSERNDQEIIVALSEAIALSGNAHTRLYLLRNRTELRRLPLRVHWFSDGLFVVRVATTLRDTLGCRVSSIAGRDPWQVRELVARLFAGNSSWVDYKSPYFMTSPEILYGLGLIEAMESVPFRFDCPGREPFDRALAPLPLQRKKTPTEAWRDLSPLWSEEQSGWESALATAPPLYLRDPVRHYWFEYLSGNRTLYLQYTRCQDMPEGASFAEFATGVEAFVRQHPIRRFILDLRFNTGGNQGIAADLMEQLVALEKGRKIGRLYVITGRATFSAGISHAAYLKQNSNATFVGEPVGDELDTWSEGGNIVLPNSGLTVHFTNGFHGLSSVEHPEYERYQWSDLDLENLAPDILVRTSSRDYLSGRDPVLEAIPAEESR
jgi:hypothetical protein